MVIDLPALMTGALAVQLSGELSFGSAGLGAAIAAARGTASLASIPVGRITDRYGATTALRLATTAAMLSAAGIALLAHSWTALTVGLIISGFAIAMGHPGANRLLSMTVPSQHQGVAFGIKQASPPAASLLAGISVPAIALTLGWRWAFGLAALLSALMLVMIGRRPVAARERAKARALDRTAQPDPDSAPGESTPVAPRAVLVWLGLGFSIGTAAAVVVPAFFVDAAVRAGSPVSTAGTLLAAASAATVAVRVSLGFIVDRMRTGHMTLCGLLLAVGTVGLVLLGTDDPALMAIGVIIATSALWGFNGVFWFAVVRLAGDRPGTMTGIMSPGGHLGGSLGPLAFGVIAAAVGYGPTWHVWTFFGLAAALSMFAAARAITRGAA